MDILDVAHHDVPMGAVVCTFNRDVVDRYSCNLERHIVFIVVAKENEKSLERDSGAIARFSRVTN
eukprot:scaffold618_cov130-Cylindrotheca_fusiformis.AAC.16